MSRRWRAPLVATLLGALLAACSDDGPGEGEARLEVDGAATVTRADGDREVVEDDTDLAPGDRVEVTDGKALMRLSGGTTFELREGLRRADDNTAVLMADRPVVEAGDLLVTTPGTAKLEADGTEVDVTEGAARVSRAFGMSVSAYDADVQLDSAGATAEVRALRRLAVPDLGRLPRASAPRPVTYEEADPWDHRYLGSAIALGEDLERLADDLFTNVLPAGSGRTPGFFRVLLPDLEDEGELQVDEDRDPRDTFIGAAITVEGDRGDFDERWEDVFEFRDQGAEWGIVVLDQDVDSDPLLGTVEEAFNSTFEEVVQAPVDVPPDTGGSDGGTDGSTDGGGTGGSSDGTDGSDGGDGGSPPTTEPPTTPPTVPPILPPPPEDPPDDLEPALEPVVDLVEDLLGGLLG